MAKTDQHNDGLAFEEVASLSETFKFTEDTIPGTACVGVFQEQREVEVDDLASGGKRLTRRYEFTDPETGGQFGVWGSGGLDWKWDQAEPPIAPGDIVRITFTGVANLDGGRTAKQFKLEVARS